MLFLQFWKKYRLRTPLHSPVFPWWIALIVRERRVVGTTNQLVIRTFILFWEGIYLYLCLSFDSFFYVCVAYSPFLELWEYFDDGVKVEDGLSVSDLTRDCFCFPVIDYFLNVFDREIVFFFDVLNAFVATIFGVVF